MSFTGVYRHSIDAKGRLIVPSRLREELEENKAVLMVMPDGCIALWSGERWRDLEARLIEQRRDGDLAVRRGIRRMAALTFQDEVDGQGRITVPLELRQEVGIGKDVVIAGFYDHAEIWSVDRWAQENATAEAEDNEEMTARIRF